MYKVPLFVNKGLHGHWPPPPCMTQNAPPQNVVCTVCCHFGRQFLCMDFDRCVNARRLMKWVNWSTRTCFQAMANHNCIPFKPLVITIILLKILSPFIRNRNILIYLPFFFINQDDSDKIGRYALATVRKIEKQIPIHGVINPPPFGLPCCVFCFAF